MLSDGSQGMTTVHIVYCDSYRSTYISDSSKLDSNNKHQIAKKERYGQIEVNQVVDLITQFLPVEERMQAVNSVPIIRIHGAYQ